MGTDTIGAITGSIAGILYGYNSINTNWLTKLRNKEYLDKIIEEFEKLKEKSKLETKVYDKLKEDFLNLN